MHEARRAEKRANDEATRAIYLAKRAGEGAVSRDHVAAAKNATSALEAANAARAAWLRAMGLEQEAGDMFLKLPGGGVNREAALVAARSALTAAAASVEASRKHAAAAAEHAERAAGAAVEGYLRYVRGGSTP